MPSAPPCRARARPSAGGRATRPHARFARQAAAEFRVSPTTARRVHLAPSPRPPAPQPAPTAPSTRWHPLLGPPVAQLALAPPPTPGTSRPIRTSGCTCRGRPCCGGARWAGQDCCCWLAHTPPLPAHAVCAGMESSRARSATLKPAPTSKVQRSLEGQRPLCLKRRPMCGTSRQRRRGSGGVHQSSGLVHALGVLIAAPLRPFFHTCSGPMRTETRNGRRYCCLQPIHCANLLVSGSSGPAGLLAALQTKAFNRRASPGHAAEWRYLHLSDLR